MDRALSSRFLAFRLFLGPEWVAGEVWLAEVELSILKVVPRNTSFLHLLLLELLKVRSEDFPWVLWDAVARGVAGSSAFSVCERA